MAKIGWNLFNVDELQILLTNLTNQLKFASYQTITTSFFYLYNLNNNKLNTIPLENIQKARIFWEHCEVRWIFRKGFFHTTVLSDDESIFNSIYSQLKTGEGDILELIKEDEHTVILWGERDTKANDTNKFWFEGRIPQKLNYPLENKGSRVGASVTIYSEKDNWKSKFYRFKEIYLINNVGEKNSYE